MHKQIHKFKKTTLNKLSHLKNQQGFTFLEIVVVITIMGFLVSMTIPAVGHISKVQKIKSTEKKLKEIKAAIIGKQDVFDENGLSVVKGYVGDMGELPKLYKSELDTTTGRWKWTAKYINDGTGQPIGIWRNLLEENILNTEDKQLWNSWKGPYISYPKAMYSDAVKNLDPEKDKELYEKKYTDGKLIDGWGRALYFIKEYEKYESDGVTGDESTATLLIISEGPDGEITLPTGTKKYSDVAEKDINKDNIVVKITPNEWYKAYNEGKEQETKELLEEIRDALIGSFKATDETGKKRIGGYIGDIGAWPVLYEHNESKKEWIELPDNTKDSGQPLALWRNILKGEREKLLWKGPYIQAPWDKQLRDAWGNKLKFKINNEGTDTEKTMTITSPGIDGKFGTDDDISITVSLSEWKNEKEGISINDEKKIKETKRILEDIRTALLGSKDARDATGRRIVGGYLADMGKWPSLYEIENGKWSKSEITDYEKKWGQPIHLWTMEDWKGENKISDGFGWKGVYLSNPYNKPLKDAWGNPIKFELDEKEITMTITSAGIDGEFYKNEGTSKLDEDKTDDIKIVIKKSEWQTSAVIEGTIYNNSNSVQIVEIEIFNSFDSSIKTDPENPIRVNPVQKEKDDFDKTIIKGGGQYKFSIPINNFTCGLRKLKITGAIDEEVDIFIGEGGTQSPSSDKLNFFIK